MENKILSLLVDNNPGVLTRIALLFSQKGFNIESMTAATTYNDKITRITIVTSGDDSHITQMMKQTEKLIEVHSVFTLDTSNSLMRELLLLKVAINKGDSSIICDIANAFNAKIIDISHNNLVTELSGMPDIIDRYLNALKDFNILEMSRSGVTALEKGDIYHY